jgi:cytochrome c oxidase subunit 3
MSASTAHHKPAHHHHHDDEHHLHNPQEPTRAEQVVMNRFGMWLFMFSEAFLFLALLAARFYLWGETRPDLEQGPALAATTILLISSYFMNRAEVSVAHGRTSDFLTSLLITAFLGLGFLFGVVFIEWGVLEELTGGHAHIYPSDGAYGAVFFAMTGIHALHVVTGVILIMIIYFNGRRGLYTPEDHWAVEACALYWHYVDIVWVLFYPALYLIGTLPHGIAH